jgi:6-phosphogluconolactonase (cycloisomerase 2 family)
MLHAAKYRAVSLLKAVATPPLFLLSIIASSKYLTAAFTPSITAVPGQPFLTVTNGAPYGMAYSPNGFWCSAANYARSNVSVFNVDASTGVLTPLLASLGNPFTAGAGAQDCAYSPDSKFLATANYSAVTVSLFNVNQTNGALSSFGPDIPTGSSEYAACLNYSPDGSFLAVANETTITTFTGAKTGLLGANPPVPLGTDNFFNDTTTGQLAWSANNLFLAAANNNSNGTVSIFSVHQTSGILDNQRQYKNPANLQQITGVAYSPNGLLFAASDRTNVTSLFRVNSDGSLILLNSISTGQPFRRQSVSFSPDGNFIAIASHYRTIYLYRVTAAGIDQTPFAGPLATGDRPEKIVFSPVYTNGVSYVSTVNVNNNTISSYAFPLTSCNLLVSLLQQ